MRLSSPRTRRVGRPVAFRFDGQEVVGIEGESLAASLAAVGILALRRTASGAPRGVHCGMGACHDCTVWVDGRSARACMTAAAHGVDVRGAMPAMPAMLPEAVPAREHVCDILVVGAAPAGLAAAIAAAEAGASVTLLDERAEAGGHDFTPLPPSPKHVRPDAQHRAEIALHARAAGIRRVRATVWGAFPGEIASVADGAERIDRARAVIVAPGAHEAPMPLPGWTLPGVLTGGGMQTLVRAQRVSPGRRVLVAGSGPLNLQLACELLEAGVTVVAVIEAAQRPAPAWWMAAAPDLAWDGARYLARLALARIPVLWGSRLDALEGDGRVTQAIAGGRRFAVDAVALHDGLVPDDGLLRLLGVTRREAEGRTNVPGVFAAGDGAAVEGGRAALAAGRIAGLAAARDLGFAALAHGSARALNRARAFQRGLRAAYAAAPAPLPDDATIVCRCEEVTAGRLRAEIAAGCGSIAALKRATRAGMGRCQGRFCATTIARLLPGDAREDPRGRAAPRPFLRPVPAAALMHEAPEFSAPLVERPVAPVWHIPATIPTTADRRCGVAVIGGGAVGLATARALARDGEDVLVIDRAEPGMGASTANAGSLHAQLLAYDVDPDDPGAETPAVRAIALGPEAIRLWQDIAQAAGEDLGLVLGGLMVATSETALRRLRAKAAVEARHGLRTDVIGPAEARALMPALGPAAGAVRCDAEGRIDPLRATLALRRLAFAGGVRALAATVRALWRDVSGWVVHTSAGPVAAGRVVIAAGAQSASVAALAGVALPVRGTVQQVIVTEPAPPLVHHLVAVADRHLSLKQSASAGLLIGGGWFGAHDAATGATTPLRRSIEGNLWVAGQVLPALRGLNVLRAWTGLAPSTDGAPVVGAVPGHPGLFVATGANGLTLGPVMGELAAAAVRGAAPDPRTGLERFR